MIAGLKGPPMGPLKDSGDRGVTTNFGARWVTVRERVLVVLPTLFVSLSIFTVTWWIPGGRAFAAGVRETSTWPVPP
jgi:hypothetical protein